MSTAGLLVPNNYPIYANSLDVNPNGGFIINGLAVTSMVSGGSLNSRIGVISFTAVATVAGGAFATLTVANSFVSTTTFVQANVLSYSLAGSSTLLLIASTAGSGAINFQIYNPTSTATGGAGEIEILFELMN
jgi:accessory gene regulator protein AgrB